ncbi:MAG TPA: hypothetical protein VKB78_07425 [Pirellulales bacterium]|nr:hypothetical protein [Pirellulales bacterium]
MNAITPINAPPTCDLLTQAIGIVRPQLERSKPLKERVEIYWAAIAAANSLAAADILREEFLRLAKDSGLAADLKQHADLYHSDKTLEHVLRWGLLRRNPFR